MTARGRKQLKKSQRALFFYSDPALERYAGHWLATLKKRKKPVKTGQNSNPVKKPVILFFSKNIS
jgi:hypothetical protein